MGISTKLSKQFKELSPQGRKRLIKMAWSDKTSFKEIDKEFGFTSNQVEKFMRSELSEKDFKRWRLRRASKFNQKSKKATLLKLA